MVEYGLRYDMTELHPSILFVGNFLSEYAGSRSAVEELSTRFEQMGWITINTSSQKLRAFRLLDMVFHVLYRRQEYEIAYVEVYSGLAFIWAEIVVRLLRLLRKPHVLVLHGGALPEFASRNIKRVKYLLAQATVVVTPSNFIRTQLQKFHNGIRYIPNGIDLNQYTFRMRSRPGPHLIWIRAFHSIYQPRMALEVLMRVRQIFTDADLIMIGPDKRDGSFQHALQYARKVNILDALTIVGGVQKSEIPEWLDKADIFLNTTLYESFGVAVLEAAAAGMLIVTTNVGELPRLWNNESDALLVSSRNINEMADATLRILNDPDLAKRLSSNARQKAKQFDWSAIMPQWERIFLEIYRSV